MNFQNVCVGDDNGLPDFQIFEFGLNFRSYDINCFFVALRTFEGHLVILHVDVGDFQLNLDLAVSFASRFFRAWRGADIARAFRGAWQALVDVGVEVGRFGVNDFDVDEIAGFQVTKVFRLIGQLYRHLFPFRPFKHDLMGCGVHRDNFGGELILEHDASQRDIGSHGAEADSGQQGSEGDGFGQCVEFHRRYIPW